MAKQGSLLPAQPPSPARPAQEPRSRTRDAGRVVGAQQQRHELQPLARQPQLALNVLRGAVPGGGHEGNGRCCRHTGRGL